MPRTNTKLTFADSVVFFSFIALGGGAAIILAAFESLYSCVRWKMRGVEFGKYTIHYNVGLSALGSALAVVIVAVVRGTTETDFSSNSDLAFIVLTVLSASNFLVLTVGTATFEKVVQNRSFFGAFRGSYLSISFTQVLGAFVAGGLYFLFNRADLVTSVFSLLVVTVLYLNYRQMFRDINESISQAEKADKEKEEIARLKIEEARRHATDLEEMLAKEEKISNDLRQSKSDLEHAAFHDSLTDLPNRAYLLERLGLLLKLGVRVSQNYYVLFLDLSRFKNINDSLGHTIGDEVLKIVALRLRRTLRDKDTAARLGGDEFAIVLNDVSSLDEAEEFAELVYERLTRPYSIKGNVIHTDVHIGIAPFDSEQIKPEDVLRDADIAMQNAKERSQGIAVFDKEVRSEYLEHIRLEGDLRYACERDEFSMHYQPLINLRTGELRGFEALLRWQHPDLGFVSPARFIPICEDSGLIVPITNWILKQATTRVAEWQKISNEFSNLLVSVNISGRHLADERLLTDVKSALEVSKLSPGCLKLEITETTAMENAEQTIEVLRQLKSLGVKISIDDFGTGYSSLSYLHRLPFDTLKIDRSFVLAVSKEGGDSQILETIIALTKNLKKEVIAEGIETNDQLSILMDFGCDYGQGYLFSRPLPVPDMEAELYKKREWIPYEQCAITPGVPRQTEQRVLF
ncbi:MAG: EAL domain-containing protein [Pyrinomonadaceae bacterium]